jgi:SlyX protein
MSAPGIAADARIEALEVKVAHLELALQELSDTLYRQQRELERVTERNAQLLNELGTPAAGTPDPATQFEKPPHY